MGRLHCPTACRDQGGLGGPSPGQHSNLQQTGHVAGGTARTTLGPVQAGEDGQVKPFPCWAQGKGVLVSSKSGPRDSEKPRGTVGGGKPRVKSNHTSRMGQCHKPQWPWAHCQGSHPCQVRGWSQQSVLTQSCGPVCADKAAISVLRGERVRPQLRWACTAAW